MLKTEDKAKPFIVTAIEDLVKAYSSDNKGEQKEALKNAIDEMKALPLEEKIELSGMVKAAKELKKEKKMLKIKNKKGETIATLKDDDTEPQFIKDKKDKEKEEEDTDDKTKDAEE